MKESSALGLLSIRIREFNRLVQSCPIVIIKLRYQLKSPTSWHAPTDNPF